MRYTKTVTVYSELQLDSLHIGQWYKLGDNGQKAQYLGRTRAGCIAAVYQNKFSKSNAKRVKLIRAWAKANGAK